MLVLVVALLGATASTDAQRRVTTSARSFQRYFHALEEAGSSADPVQRLLLSLVLAKAAPNPQQQ